MIRKLKVKNYKSLKDVELELDKFNVLIGPNTSGKSNLLDCLTFVSEIAKGSIDGSLRGRGGYERVVFSGEKENIELSIDFMRDNEASEYFIRHQIEFRKTHDLGELIDLVATVDKTLASELSFSVWLTDFAVDFRYPGELPVGKEIARRAITDAEKVKEIILDALDDYLSQGRPRGKENVGAISTSRWLEMGEAGGGVRDKPSST